MPKLNFLVSVILTIRVIGTERIDNMPKKYEKFEGTITHVLHTGENDFAIVKVKMDKGKLYTALGKIPYPIKGLPVELTGELKYSEKYNEDQLYVKSCKSTLSDKAMSAMKFLGSGCIKGIGPSTAKAIVMQYGTDVAAIMGDDKKLLSISGISEKKLKKIKSSYEKNKELFEIYNVTNGSVTFNQATKIFEKYKDKASFILNRNPYQMIYDIDGFGFIKADTLALKSGFLFDSRERTNAAMVYCLKSAAQENGHCYLPKAELKERVRNLLFSLKELKNVMYQDVLDTSVPDDNTLWDSSTLGSMIKNHARRLNNILDRWGEDEYRDKVYKDENFSTEEIDCLDIFYSKKIQMDDLFDDLLNDLALDLTGVRIKDALSQLALSENTNKKLVIQKGRLGEVAVFEKDNFLLECEIAMLLTSMNHLPPIRKVNDKDILDSIAEVEAESGHPLGDEQKEGIFMALQNRVSILTGGPGRGKTTIIKVALKAWEKSQSVSFPLNAKPESLLLAPTGKAARRMSESTGYPAGTIHRKLMEPAVMNDSTIVFVDESSMADLILIKKLLQKVGSCQLCFVGDVDQLPSVGIGAFLSDIIESKVIPCTRLIQCYRNSGSILKNSDVVNSGGTIKQLEHDNHFKMVWSQDDAETIKKNTVKIYEKYTREYDISDIVVLTPMRERPCGVKALNKAIQERVNPKASAKPELYIKDEVLRLGDRVIHTKNDYNIECLKDGLCILGVFNGETGTITSIDTLSETLEITFDDGKIGYYDYINAYELSLGYALTYHKSQGSEYKCVICVLTTGDYVLLQKKILYTGESRAQDLCIFHGMAKAFQCAMNDAGGGDAKRNTMLKNRLIELN